MLVRWICSAAVFAFIGLSACGKDESLEAKKTSVNALDSKAIFSEGCAKDLFEQDMKSDHITNTGSAGVLGQYKVELDSTAHISRLAPSIILKTHFVMTDISPAIARSQAQEKVDKLNGNRTGYLLDDDWIKYFSGEGNPNVHCTIYPITVSETLADSGKKTVVKFTPALPFSISPSQEGAVYTQEIGTAGLDFKNIEAEVVETGDSGYKAGSTFEGAVHISAVDPTPEKAEYAFRIQTDFGDITKTQALGLIQDATYYVSGRTFKTIVVSTGNDSTPQVTYRSK